MRFVCTREELLQPLNAVVNVVERRQTLPILANALFSLEKGELAITGTDMEVELLSRTELSEPSEDGSITVPARKMADICKSLPEGSTIKVAQDEQKLILKSGRSRYTLTTLPASEFPNTEQGRSQSELNISDAGLKHMLDRTAFAMAQQDVRYYLNGMLFELSSEGLRLVATDGHRLAMCTSEHVSGIKEDKQIILPRKGVIELSRLLSGDDESEITLSLMPNHLRATVRNFQLTSKLVDGKFPDYKRVLPSGTTKTVGGDRNTMRQAFARAAILANEKYRGVRLLLSNDALQIMATNPEQEEAEETIAVDYQGEDLEIGFNVNYLMDVLSAVSNDNVQISLSDANSSALIEAADADDALYVIMPMRI